MHSGFLAEKERFYNKQYIVINDAYKPQYIVV